MASSLETKSSVISEHKLPKYASEKQIPDSEKRNAFTCAWDSDPKPQVPSAAVVPLKLCSTAAPSTNALDPNAVFTAYEPS